MGNCLLPPIPNSNNSPALSSSSSSSSSRPPDLPNMAVRRPSLDASQAPPKRRRFSPSSLLVLPHAHPDIRRDYNLEHELGRGQFGVIRKCIHKLTGQAFACKSIPKLRLTCKQDVEDVRREVEIMEHLSGHPNVVELKGLYEDKAFVHIVMELCEGGELFDRIVKRHSYPESDAALLIHSLVKVVKYCHSMGVMHRDLKPENILLANASESAPIKLADFGLALRFAAGQKFTGMAGSAYYIAPEVLNGEYTEEVDVWSVGVILYVLLSGVPPFWGETEKGIFEAINEGKLDFSSDPWWKISSGAKDLIRRMLNPDAKARLTPAQVLAHPWILRHVAHMKSQVVRDALTQDKSCNSEAPMFSAASQAFCPESPTPLLESFASHSAAFSDLTDLSVSSSSHVPTHRGFDLFPVPPPAPHPILALSSVSSINSSCCLLDSRGEESCAHRSTACAPHTDVTFPSTQSQSPVAGSDRFTSTQVAEPSNELLKKVIAGLDSWPLPSPGSFTQVRMQDGCTCTILKASADEHTVVVESRQGRFLVLHDRLRNRIGWKPLDQQDCRVPDSRISPFSTLPANSPLFQQSQLVF